MKKIYLSFLFIVATCIASKAQTTVIAENFDDVNNMLSSGWMEINNSAPVGPEIWHQGTGNVGSAPVSGDPLGYAEVGYQSTDPSGTGDINNWLISPTMQLNNGDVVTFFAASYNTLNYPDRLELRLNPLNTTDVGTTSSSTGDFSILLTEINPNLLLDSSYFSAYFKAYTATVSGLSGATNARIAFRYWVTDGGGLGLNSSTIGVDSLTITTVVGVRELDAFHTTLYPNPAQNLLTMTWSQPLASAFTAEVYNSVGQLVMTQELEKGLHRNSFDISSLAKGIYTVRLSGAEGVSHSRFVKN
jgi:hypothetical protein